MMENEIKRLEELIPNVVKEIILGQNSIWNMQQAATLKSLTGALNDLVQYNEGKKGKNVPSKPLAKTGGK